MHPLPSYNEPYKLDEQQSNILNQGENFCMVNISILQFIKDTSRNDDKDDSLIILDVEKCEKIIEEIEYELVRDKAYDVLEGI